MSVDVKIHNARSALSTLSDLAFCVDETNLPADEFCYGLAVLLGYVVKNLEEAQEEFFQYTKNLRPKNREGEGETPESPEAAGGDVEALLESAIDLVPQGTL